MEKDGITVLYDKDFSSSCSAYHRREYALTVSALSTLWEGIIQEKVNDNSYRVSRKTRENLTKLIEENEFDKIFASFCEEFIFYDCRKVEEVKTRCSRTSWHCTLLVQYLPE